MRKPEKPANKKSSTKSGGAASQRRPASRPKQTYAPGHRKASSPPGCGMPPGCKKPQGHTKPSGPLPCPKPPGCGKPPGCNKPPGCKKPPVPPCQKPKNRY